MKKVLVTGGAGFIGSNLVKFLLDKNYVVSVYDNLSTGHYSNLESFEDKITFIKADIRESREIKQAISQVDYVIHLAAMVSVSESVLKPKECFEVNVLATLTIMEFCAEQNKKFIFASSAAVYGEDITEIKSEDLIPNPHSPYGISKLDVEKLCILFNKERSLNYTCFRNFNVYGLKQDPHSSYAAVIPIFISRALQNKDLIIYGDGEQTRDFVHVSDVCAAYILALENNCVGIFNLGCNEICSVSQIAKLILDKTKSKSQLKYEKKRKGDIKHSRASSEKFQKISGWNPKIKIEIGITNLILSSK